MNDLNSFASRLLNFVEDSVKEAINDPSSQCALLSEADCAVRILQKTVNCEGPAKHAQLMLLGAQQLGGYCQKQFTRGLEDAGGGKGVETYPRAAVTLHIPPSSEGRCRGARGKRDEVRRPRDVLR